jgi:hypothetical protein
MHVDDGGVIVLPPIGSPSMQATKLGSPELGIRKIGYPKIGSRKICATKINPVKISEAEVGSPEIGSRKLGLPPSIHIVNPQLMETENLLQLFRSVIGMRHKLNTTQLLLNHP